MSNFKLMPKTPIVGNLVPFSKNPLEFLHGAAKSLGWDVPIRFHLFSKPITFFAAPEALSEVLTRSEGRFQKGSFPWLSVLFGRGLTVSSGDFWRSQRRHLNPPFKKSATPQFAWVQLEATQAFLSSLDTMVDRGETEVEVANLYQDLTSRAILLSIFGRVEESWMENLREMGHHAPRFAEMNTKTPIFIPQLPWNRVMIRTIGECKEWIRVALRKDRPKDRPTMLSMIDLDKIEALVDEIVNLILGGFETSQGTFTCATYLLSQYPEVQRKLQEEADRLRIDRERIPNVAELSYARAVILETLRLYPGIALLGRVVAEDGIRVQDCLLPEGHNVFVCPWVTHRHPKLWSDPERFDPARFLEGGEASRVPRGGYSPFGMGPRRCIGEHFALQQLTVTVAYLSRFYEFRLPAGHPPLRVSGIPIRPSVAVKPLFRRRQVETLTSD